ncbi:MAG: DUF4368 domain-containing protein [Eubacteriales bacterium]|nr:DUF4368 domain-containing protein [Eubacteriales bacterium]
MILSPIASSLFLPSIFRNQKKLLQKTANEYGYDKTKVFVDDGVSGTTFERPGFKKMEQAVLDGFVGAVFVKDMSRLGRDYLKCGFYTDSFFPDNDVRFVAVNDGVDSANGENEFAPFRNIMNEWYARDASRKVRMAHRIRGNSGEPLSKAPYGYIKNPNNPKFWVIDEYPASVVRRIYSMYLDGSGIEQIAGQLEKDEILTPNSYAKQNGLKVSGKVHSNQNFWKHSTISKILSCQEYCGDIINFKTYSKSYKNKVRHKNAKENHVVFENVHEPIIQRDIWEAVQLKRGKVRNTRKATGEHNMFSGLLECSTCGGNLNFHFNQGNHDITYFNCANYNNRNSTCDATHYIRTDFLEQVVKNDLNRIISFTKQYEGEFMEILLDSSIKEKEKQTTFLEKEFATLSARNTELDNLFERIYEDSINGKITEERFAKMSRKYEDEQAENQNKLDVLQNELRSRAKKQGTASEFLSIIRRYTDIETLTPQMLREFVEKIVIHHRQREDGVDVQRIEIFYNCVGQLALPEKDELPEMDILMKTRKGVALCLNNKETTPLTKVS